MKRNLLSIVTLSLLAVPSAAFASGSDTDNMGVSALVSDNCTIAADDLAFGPYDTVSGSAVPGSALITVACTSGASASVTLDEGENAELASAPDAPLRQMTDGTHFLTYNLYSDEGLLSVWGGTSGTGVDYDATSADPSEITVFGQIDGSQDVPAGSYADNVIATISF